MILTCPDCSTRYSIKDGSIGPNGRTVRCASCNATWFVSQEADELALIDLQSAELETIDDFVNSPATHAQEDFAPAHETTQTEMNMPHVSPPKAGAHVQFRDKVDRERRNRRLFGVSMIWIVTLGLLCTFAILGYAFRQDIVDRNNSLSSIYKALNIPVTVDGLDFEAPATRHVIVDGVPTLIVNGMIINRSKKSRPIPMIELSFINNSGDPITKWIVEPAQKEIGPNERVEYVSQYPNPPVDAADLAYRFADDAVPAIDLPEPNGQ